MMISARANVIVTILVIMMLLNGCAAVQPPIGPGDVLTIQQGQVLWGIQQAINLKPATDIFRDPTGCHYLITWPAAGNQAWAFVSQSLEDWLSTGSKGNIGMAQTWGELKLAISEAGWVKASPIEFTAVMGLRTIAVISRALPMPMLIVPAVLLNPIELINPKVPA